MKNKWLVLAFTTSLLLGCRTVGPDYRRPMIKTPDVFRGVADQPKPEDAASLSDVKWFDVFKDEGLQRLNCTALVQNYDLRDAVVRVDAARANLAITRADQVPTIGAGFDVTTVRSSRNGSIPFPS